MWLAIQCLPPILSFEAAVDAWEVLWVDFPETGAFAVRNTTVVETH